MKNNKLMKWATTWPVIIYSFLLIVLPLVYIFIISFFQSDSYGGMNVTFTLKNYLMLFDLVYIKVFLKSFLIGGLTTLICILIAYPFSLCLRRQSEKVQSLCMILVIIPFLTNSLIRTYGWIVLLRKEGVVNSFLKSIGLIEESISFMYNDFGIVVGLVYTLLPFMILPIYGAVSKLNNSVLEASRDLGANGIQTFFRVIVPETMSGVVSGILMVFIPAIGYFFISDILGGGKLMLIGNLIKNQFLTARNWPFGAATSIFLIIITLVLVKLYKKTGGNMDDLGGI
ncbi:MAG: ABC transporter permease [Bacilli bacterium]|nr:ABC transporter permease [Bacilli bacterium]